jgi:hypothetical protein
MLHDHEIRRVRPLRSGYTNPKMVSASPFKCWPTAQSVKDCLCGRQSYSILSKRFLELSYSVTRQVRDPRRSPKFKDWGYEQIISMRKRKELGRKPTQIPLTDWLTHWLTDWLTDLLTNWLTDRLADWLTHSLTDKFLLTLASTVILGSISLTALGAFRPPYYFVNHESHMNSSGIEPEISRWDTTALNPCRSVFPAVFVTSNLSVFSYKLSKPV